MEAVEIWEMGGHCHCHALHHECWQMLVAAELLRFWRCLVMVTLCVAAVQQKFCEFLVWGFDPVSDLLAGQVSHSAVYGAAHCQWLLAELHRKVAVSVGMALLPPCMASWHSCCMASIADYLPAASRASCRSSAGWHVSGSVSVTTCCECSWGACVVHGSHRQGLHCKS